MSNPTFPTARPGESKSEYRARLHAYSTRRAQYDGIVRASRAAR